MDLWTFHRYQQPRLCVDAIELDRSSPMLKLRSGKQIYRLAFDDYDAAAQIGADLTSLSDSHAPLWTTLRESPADSSWNALGTFLDTHSLILEARDGAAENLKLQARRIEDCIESTVAAVLQGVSHDRQTRTAAHAAMLRQGLSEAATRGSPFGADADPFDAAVQPNFFLGLVAVEFEYFRRFSPITLAAVDVLLGRIAGESDGRLDLTTSTILSEACGLYDLQDLEAHLWLVGNCIVRSTSEDAARFETPKLPAVSLCSGLEFMRQTEILTRDTLFNWGQNPYVTALDALNDSYSPLVAGPFIEQYHVTRRFVEIVAPLLSRRLSAPLRQMMFRYFGEEVGHECARS
jgi:hypothetical protein